MTAIEVNGKVIHIRPTKSLFKKTAYQLAQETLDSFKKIGITRDYIVLELPRNPLKRDTPAEISWVVNGKDHYYSCNTQETYRDNLGVISRVIYQDCYAIRNGMKSFGQVMSQFRLDYDPDSQRTKTPREILGIPEHINDKDYIKFKYKQKAKELHPDQGGDTEKFKELKEAYENILKELKKED